VTTFFRHAFILAAKDTRIFWRDRFGLVLAFLFPILFAFAFSHAVEDGGPPEAAPRLTVVAHEKHGVLREISAGLTASGWAVDKRTRQEAVEAAASTGYPVVLKGCGADLTHKSEAGAVKLNLTTSAEVASAFTAIEAAAAGALDGILVQPQIKGTRELVAGMIRDPQFGPCVMFGLGGIFTEVLDDACFRIALLEERDALAIDGQHPRLGNPRPRPRYGSRRPCRPVQNPDHSRAHRPGERQHRSDRRQPAPTAGRWPSRGGRRRDLDLRVTGLQAVPEQGDGFGVPIFPAG